MSVTDVITYSGDDPSNDIAEGNNLGLFSFTLDYRAGNISFDACLSGDDVVSGTTSLVPDPVISTFFITGGAVSGFRHFRRKRKIT